MRNEKRLFREERNSIDTGNFVSQVFLTCLMGIKLKKVSLILRNLMDTKLM